MRQVVAVVMSLLMEGDKQKGLTTPQNSSLMQVEACMTTPQGRKHPCLQSSAGESEHSPKEEIQPGCSLPGRSGGWVSIPLEPICLYHTQSLEVLQDFPAANIFLVLLSMFLIYNDLLCLFLSLGSWRFCNQ